MRKFRVLGSRRTWLGGVLIAALTATSCGGGERAVSIVDSDIATSTTEVPDELDTTSVPATTTAPEVTTQPATTPATTAPQTTLPDATLPDGDAALKSALTALEQATAYRVSASTATTLIVAALNISNRQHLDPERPMTVVSVDADGEIHTALDLGPTLAALATSGTDPAVAEALDQVSAELWLSGDRLVIDATGYAPLAAVNPAADLGPFAPGVGVVDLARFEDVGGEELLGVLIGSTPVDPVVLGQRLPDALSNIEQTGPVSFSAAAMYSDVVTAMGGDLEQSSLGAAVGIAQALGIDPNLLGAFYADFFRRSPAVVEIELAASGALETVLIMADFSGLYDELFTTESGLFSDVSESDLAEARAQFANTEFSIESLMQFEIDPSIEVELPTGDLEDRTELALAYLASVG